MTPADILAAARISPLSPVVPAREAWLKDWIGPALAPTGAKNGGSIEVAIVGTDGGRAYWYCIEADRFDFGDGEDLRLDLRRPEVRDRLVRCGAPEWCRDSVAGMLAWVVGIRPAGWLHRWLDGARSAGSDVCTSAVEWIGTDVARAFESPDICARGWRGWALYLAGARRDGPETGPEGRACADLAALRAGCVLEEADGWYIPLPDGAVGWLPKENA